MRKVSTIVFGLLIAAAGLGAWYWVDRPTMLHAACAIGLPNYSIPSELDQEDVGCAILTPKGRFKGILVTGFEASNFSSPDFPPVRSEFGPSDTRAWFHCPKNGCGDQLDNQLDQDYLNGCIKDSLFHSGFATIEVDGWVTVSDGAFGHLNSYPRDFYASRIVNVGPPPANMIADWIDGYRRHDMCD
ncbi:hypothetical protein [Altererythrobacter sp. Z27]|uniref:hypothetical protein n=1 Tax=Altererythrobacter sp. Z27 TaxID=3461147 RepID=UPI004043CB11